MSVLGFSFKEGPCFVIIIHKKGVDELGVYVAHKRTRKYVDTLHGNPSQLFVIYFRFYEKQTKCSEGAALKGGGPQRRPGGRRMKGPQ